MIVWFNCKITDIRLHPHLCKRYTLRTDCRFDIALYSFASLAPLDHLVSKYIFCLDLAEFAGREQEMENWLKSKLSADKVIIYWHRCDYLNQWLEIAQLIDSIPDDLVLFNANEDHIFMDSNSDLFDLGLQTIAKDPDPTAVLMISHYPEHVRTSHVFGGYLTDDGNFTVYQQGNNDSIRVIKKQFLYWYINQQRPENKFFRFEDWNRVVLPRNTIYSAINEQFRHYDGYWCCEIGAEVCPPVEMPPHFFDGMTIRYGFKDRDPECVNINPLAENLYSIDPINGTDYKFTLDDLPAFWYPYIKEIIVAPDVDPAQMDLARDRHYLDKTQINFPWDHFGIVMTDENKIPSHWPQRAMKVLQLPQEQVYNNHGTSLSSN
jgi:hypothetical protein